MPAIDFTALSVENIGLTAVANTAIGTSAALTSGGSYLIIGTGGAANTGNLGDANSMDFLVGGTVFSRMRNQHADFSPSGVDQSANGGIGHHGFAVTHTPGASETMQMQAWADVASGDAYAHVYALNLDGVTIESAETANSDTIVDTPAAASGWNVVGDTLSFTATAEDYIVFASVELVADGTAASGDHFHARLVLDGVAVDGTPISMNVGGLNTSVHSFMWARRLTLTAGTREIEVEVNGTTTNGNIGARRIRIHAIRAAEFTETQQVTVGGTTISPAADDDPAGFDLDIGDGSRDYLLFMGTQMQGSFWGECHFVVGGTEQPSDGWGQGSVDGGTGVGPVAADDMTMWTGLHVAEAPAASTNVQGRFTKTGSFGVNDWGTDAPNAEAGDMYLIAIALETPDASGILLTPDAMRVDFNVQAPAQILGGLTQTPAALVSQFTTPAATVSLGAVTQAPAAEQGQFTTPAAALSLGGIVHTPTADRARFTTPAAALSIGALTQGPAALRGQWNTPAATVTLGSAPTITLTPPVMRARWATPTATLDAPTTLTAGAQVGQFTTPAVARTLGALTRSPAAERARWATPTPAIQLGAVARTPGALRARFTTPAASVGTLIRPEALRARFTTPLAAVSVGAVTTQPVALRARWTTPAPTVTGGEDLFVAPYGMSVAPDLAAGMLIDPGPSIGMVIDED